MVFSYGVCVDVLAKIVEATCHYIILPLKSKTPDLAKVLGFYQGAMSRSYQVLKVIIIVKMRLDFQITVPSFFRMLVLGYDVRITSECDNVLNEQYV